MLTYTWRCKPCKVDWLKKFRITKVPKSVVCPECGADCRQVITNTNSPNFTTHGFPGNDMKHLHTGNSSGSVGRKPTEKELEQVEKQYPGGNDKTYLGDL